MKLINFKSWRLYVSYKSIICLIVIKVMDMVDLKF